MYLRLLSLCIGGTVSISMLFACGKSDTSIDAGELPAPRSDADAAAEDAAADADAAEDAAANEDAEADAAAEEDGGVTSAHTGPCAVDTEWEGDDKCIEPPDPDAGFQIHFGPGDYDDPDELARFILAPGEETVLCTYMITPNDQEIHYSDWLNSLRPGSHHMVTHMVGADIAPASGVACSQGGGVSEGGLVGGNTTTLSPLADVAPENVGLARTIPAHSGISMQVHFFNFTEKPLLMEVWVNIYYMDESEVRGVTHPIEGISGLGMSVEPGTTEVIAGRMAAPQDLRVMNLFSHNHDHTRRFSAFLVRKDQTERELIYESYDWEHPLMLPLDSIHTNGQADRDGMQAGGLTGMLELVKGDVLEWECEIENNDLDAPLMFGNLAHEAEMCILRGEYFPSFGRVWSAYVQ
jgi:hypothetical protein